MSSAIVGWRDELATTALTLRRARLVAAGTAVIQFALYQPPAGLHMPYSRVMGAGALVLGLLAVNAVSWWATRTGDARTMRRAAIAELAADTAMVLLLVWLFSFDPTSALWALLILPVLEAAVRAGLRGALLTWAFVSLVYLLRNLWASTTYAHIAVNVDGVTYVSGILGIVALTVGLLTRQLHARTVAYREAQAEAEAQTHQLENAHRLLSHQAYHDSLTSLPNRARFLERLRNALERGEGGAPPAVGVVFADLDGLKGVNDRFGHAAGDELLRLAAARLRTAVRGHDVVARLGGDEFTVLVRDAREDQLAALADRLLAAFRTPFALDGSAVHATLSLGLAVGVPGQDTADRVLGTADTAMYEAKRAGGDRWHLRRASTNAGV